MILFLAIASGGAKIHVIFESLPTYDRKGRCKVKCSYFQLGVSGIFEEATRKQSPCTLTWRKPLPRFVSVKGFLCRYTYLHNPVFNIKTRNTNFLWVFSFNCRLIFLGSQDCLTSSSPWIRQRSCNTGRKEVTSRNEITPMIGEWCAFKNKNIAITLTHVSLQLRSINTHCRNNSQLLRRTNFSAETEVFSGNVSRSLGSWFPYLSKGI